MRYTILRLEQFMLRIICFLISCILLTACDTTNNQELLQTVHTWQGSTAKALTQKWGEPTNLVNNPDGTGEYIYIIHDRRFSPPAAPIVATTVSGGRPITVTSQPNYAISSPLPRCIVRFNINQQKIITKVTTQGNNCDNSLINPD